MPAVIDTTTVVILPAQVEEMYILEVSIYFPALTDCRAAEILSVFISLTNFKNKAKLDILTSHWNEMKLKKKKKSIATNWHFPPGISHLGTYRKKIKTMKK